MHEERQNTDETGEGFSPKGDSGNAISYTVDSLQGEWVELIKRPDGTIEERRRTLKATRRGMKSDYRVVLLLALAAGLFFWPDLLGPIAKEVFRTLSRSG